MIGQQHCNEHKSGECIVLFSVRAIFAQASVALFFMSLASPTDARGLHTLAARVQSDAVPHSAYIRFPVHQNHAGYTVRPTRTGMSPSPRKIVTAGKQMTTSMLLAAGGTVVLPRARSRPWCVPDRRASRFGEYGHRLKKAYSCQDKQ